MGASTGTEEVDFKSTNGYLALVVAALALAFGIWAFLALNPLLGIGAFLAFVLVAKGLYMLQPNQAALMLLFGDYRGTDYSTGLRCANPLTWTKHARLNAIMQPEAFVEISEELAKEKGIRHGDSVKVSSNRGHIVTKAVVTKRIKPWDCNDQKVHLVGIPFHWGFKGQTKNGYIANTLTPFVGDANSQTPEFKAFPVNTEKV